MFQFVLLPAQGRLIKLHLVTTINQNKIGRDDLTIIGFKDRARVHIVLEYQPEGQSTPVYLTELDSLVIENHPVHPSQKYHFRRYLSGRRIIKWYQLLPADPDSSYRNPIHINDFCKIEYQEVELKKWQDSLSITPDFNLSGTLKIQGKAVGTIFLKAEFFAEFQLVSTPGKESRFRLPDGRDFGGLDTTVFHLSRISNFSNYLLNYFLIFANLPHITNPVSFTPLISDHQTTNFIGGNISSSLIAAYYLVTGDNIRSNQGLLPESNNFELTNYYWRKLVLTGDYYSPDLSTPVRVGRQFFTTGDLLYNYDLHKWAIFLEDLSPTGFNDSILNVYDRILVEDGTSYRLLTLGDFAPGKIAAIRWNKRFHSVP